ncbi:hypothetical protein D3C81_10160 [compost metagenome]
MKLLNITIDDLHLLSTYTSKYRGLEGAYLRVHLGKGLKEAIPNFFTISLGRDYKGLNSPDFTEKDYTLLYDDGVIMTDKRKIPLIFNDYNILFTGVYNADCSKLSKTISLYGTKKDLDSVKVLAIASNEIESKRVIPYVNAVLLIPKTIKYAIKDPYDSSDVTYFSGSTGNIIVKNSCERLKSRTLMSYI